MDTTKNLNFSANIPQLEWLPKNELKEVRAIIPKTTSIPIASIYYKEFCFDKEPCYFVTYFGGDSEICSDKPYTIEEAKKEIQYKYINYVCSLLNEVAKVTTNSFVSYNDLLKK